MSQDDQPHLSLLSLSIAATNAAPISVSLVPENVTRSSQSVTTNTTKHRRLSSAGRSRRRLSDARDAATRPFPMSLQTASASFAALSISSPKVSHRPVPGAQPIQVPRATSVKGSSDPEPANVGDTQLSASNSVNVTKSGRKRGTVFTCESCSKVYRHPSCLIKHRWEHTPQWREASKFVLSKHQQVQLLEAAAILSHLSPFSASLPEDRSLWPSFLSGGLVPPLASALNVDVEPIQTTTVSRTSTSSVHTPYPISSSMPASGMMRSCPGSTGPRSRNHSVVGNGTSITEFRSGALGVSTVPRSASSPMPVPAHPTMSTREDDALNLLALRSASVTSGSLGSPASASASPPLSSLSDSRSHGHSHSHSLSASHTLKERERRRSNAYEYGMVSASGFGYDYRSCAYTLSSNGGWSLPRSSIRSKSGSSVSRSRSQSASESRSDDEDEPVFGNADLKDGMDGARVRQTSICAWKTEDEDGAMAEIGLREDEREDAEDVKSVKWRVEQMWDGMEMEMEMD